MFALTVGCTVSVGGSCLLLVVGGGGGGGRRSLSVSLSMVDVGSWLWGVGCRVCWL